MSTRRAALLTVGALAAGAIGAAAAGAPVWRETASVHISGDNNEITALVATGSQDVWAFGQDYSTVGEWRVLGERWNGTTWVRLDMPDRETAPAQDFLSGAAATGPDDVWAVGASATAQGNLMTRELIEHWDGRRWSIETPQILSGLPRELSAVATASPGDVWAVGDVTPRSGPDYVPLVLHRTARGWATVRVGLPVPGCRAFARGVLTRIVARGPSDLYAAGWCQFENLSGPNGPQRWYVAHWNGSAWSLAFEAPQGDEIGGLALAPGGEVWAGGDTGAPGASEVRGLLWHGLGTTWSAPIALPGGAGAQGAIRAVAVTGTTVFAGGTYAISGSSKGYVLAFDAKTHATTFEPIAPLDPTASPIFVNSLVAPTPGAPWMGGHADERTGGQGILARRGA